MRGPRPKYPFREMAVGEQRVITTRQKNFSQYAHVYGERLGRKFRTFRVGDAVRLTRIA
jgi:hypothetical protein